MTKYLLPSKFCAFSANGPQKYGQNHTVPSNPALTSNVTTNPSLPQCFLIAHDDVKTPATLSIKEKLY